VIGRLRGFASGPPPDAFEAASLLRLVYLSVFGGQMVLALLVGLAVATFVPGRGAPNDIVAVVLLAMAVFHLPLGWVLGRAAVRAGGRQGALSGIIAAAVMLSIPAWFGVLLLVSGQRPVYLMGIAAVVSVGYSLGFLLTATAARVAAADTPPDDASRPIGPAPHQESPS
jgi:hypothetical protein